MKVYNSSPMQIFADAKLFEPHDRLFIAVPLTSIHCRFEVHPRHAQHSSKAQGKIGTDLGMNSFS
jgi:hypothetical protein